MFETFHKCILKFYLKISGLIKYYCEEFQMTLKVVCPVFIMNVIRNTSTGFMFFGLGGSHRGVALREIIDLHVFDL